MFILTVQKAGALNCYLHSEFSSSLSTASGNFILLAHALQYLALQGLTKITGIINRRENSVKELRN